MLVYRHTQRSRILEAAFFIAAFGLVVIGGFVEAPPAIFAAVPGIALAGWIFSALTVEVHSDRLRWWFGPGLFRKETLRADIVAARPVRNPWWYGWGVRLTPRGWLYAVEGLDAVEIQRRDGARVRLGTNDPAGLTKALQEPPDRIAAAGASH